MRSFRRRIQTSTLGLIILLLVSFDIGLYLGFQHVLHHYVDTKLEAMADGWAEIARRNLGMLLDASQNGQGAAVQSAVSDEEERIELRDAALSIEVLSLDGSVLWKGAAVVSGPRADPELLSTAKAGLKVFATVRDGAGGALRRVWVPILQQGKVQYILQAETPLRFIEKALNGLAALLCGASGIILVLAWLGSNWLTRQTLTPVELLSATALDISKSSLLTTRLELDASYDEFRRLAQAFNTMMDRIQRMVDAQRRFVTDAAHEIKTPLTALKGNLEVAFRRNRRASEYRQTLIANMVAVERLMDLCRSLITLTRLAGADCPEPHRPIALEPLLRELIEDLEVLAQDRGIRLVFHVTRAASVIGHKEQLQRVFINLLDNALRHTPKDGEVSVRLGGDQNKSNAVVSISDTGEGISPEHLPRIFDRFYRADGARSRHAGGVGLGLAIVQEIIKAHAGCVDVQSEIGKGSTFIISFPPFEPPGVLPS